MLARTLMFSCLFALLGCEKANVVAIKTESLKQVVLASGELESKQTQYIAPPAISRMWQYQIKSLAPENSKIEQGQVVVSFDDKQVVERLVEENGKLTQAKKELENKVLKEQEKEQELILTLAEKQMDFDKAQRRANIIDNSQSDNDRKKSQIDFTIAKAELVLAKRKLAFHKKNSASNLNRLKAKVSRISGEVALLKSDIERLKVKSPINGLAIYRANWQGEKPAVGENIQFGQPVVEIAVIEAMQLRAQITEPDSGKVALGQVVDIYLDTAKDKVYKGEVVELGRVFRDKSYQDRSRVFDVIIDINDIDLEVMKPGMSARIEVISSVFENHLTLPVQAIQKSESGYYVVKDSFLGEKQIPVSVMRVISGRALVSGDISEGLEVNL
ncbi:hypothetical protein theurythT_11210 [Thalassotalea eurytherma]|uniref:YknX-like beta-barrel domain-containing protein n=2 Tax=Thalassotalea eurytherma TaxID=1144278 RepID=A0ABQ6H2F8_9GAMM|nr:hypothetical protein theurythT_11210 [Thalassotalea eurytherma]